MSNDDLPVYYTQRKGSLYVSKGNVNGMKVISWDAVKECFPDCPARSQCGYTQGRCRVQMNYITEIFKQFLAKFPDIDEFQLTQFGTLLMPLYTTLSWMQIAEVAVQQPTFLTDNGARKAHPLYKEIRETIRLITATAKSIGLDGVPIGSMDPSKLQKKVNDYGDPDALFDMEEEEETKTKGKFKVKK